jgi:hypothetical protein
MIGLQYVPELHNFWKVGIDNKGKLAAAFSNGSLLLSALKDDDTFEVLAKWNEPRLAENTFIGLSLDDGYCRLIFSLRISLINPAVPSLVALPMEPCERPHVTLEAIVARKQHLSPADCVTGECPTMEKLSLTAATKSIFQFGMQSLHGSVNQNLVLCWDHLKSGK